VSVKKTFSVVVAQDARFIKPFKRIYPTLGGWSE
jgi:hypothetical protein